MNKPKTIYLDLDGVLADFDARIKNLLGKPLEEYSTSQEGWDALEPFKPNFFAWLEPMRDAYDLYRGVLSLALLNQYEVAVLTAIPKIGRMPFAKQDKKEWVTEYFPKLACNFNIGPHAEHKQYHCTVGDVLIDDSIRNIDQWRSVGGYGILHTSAKDSLQQLKEILT